MSKRLWWHKTTGTIYVSYELGHGGMAEVKTEAGSVYVVQADHIEELLQPPSEKMPAYKEELEDLHTGISKFMARAHACQTDEVEQHIRDAERWLADLIAKERKQAKREAYADAIDTVRDFAELDAALEYLVGQVQELELEELPKYD